jgi:hypothetical protein
MQAAFGEKSHAASADPDCSLYEFAVKPQMKKYRCLWCMSTTNHYILYFVNISRTCPLNTVIYLWKACNSLAGSGFARPESAKCTARIGFQPASSSISSLFPADARHKRQK